MYPQRMTASLIFVFLMASVMLSSCKGGNIVDPPTGPACKQGPTEFIVGYDSNSNKPYVVGYTTIVKNGNNVHWRSVSEICEKESNKLVKTYKLMFYSKDTKTDADYIACDTIFTNAQAICRDEGGKSVAISNDAGIMNGNIKCQHTPCGKSPGNVEDYWFSIYAVTGVDKDDPTQPPSALLGELDPRVIIQN